MSDSEKYYDAACPDCGGDELANAEGVNGRPITYCVDCGEVV